MAHEENDSADEHTRPDAAHWRRFNILIRLSGLMAVVFSLACLAGAVRFTVHPEQATNIEPPGQSVSENVVLGLAVALLAALVLTARPYRPDLGDRAFSDHSLRWLLGLPSGWERPKPRHVESARRNWWTGDVLKTHSR
jgi:hypothetical protein